MATLYVSEFSRLANIAGKLTGVALTAPVAEQTVAIDVGSTQSAAFNAATKVIRVHADAVCSISVGSDPTATASLMRLAQNQTEYFGVSPGHKIAAITNS